MLKQRKEYADIALVVLFAIIPLFMNFPYRVNIFLSWEGAYRISEGQLPFRDFGTPLGGMYWMIPALFFKLFGAKMITLVKAQVFINILSGLAFRSILKSFSFGWALRFLCVFVYCISFSFFNFWPWYNHSVIVYEFIGIAFVLRYITQPDLRSRLLCLVLGGLFIVCSFLTKQDGGGMALVLGFMLLLYHALTAEKRDYRGVLVYAGSFALFLAFYILICGASSFGYWFNHGQPPHTSRVSAYDLVAEFLSGSQWIKFYVFVLILLLLPRLANIRELWKDRQEMLFLLLVIGILGEATVFQLTSYTPPDNNIFFHSFAIAYILWKIGRINALSFSKPLVFAGSLFGILLWWSGTYWKYMQRVAAKTLSQKEVVQEEGGENIVNRQTYMQFPKPDTGEPESQWTYCGLKSFDRIYMPSSTVKGIHRLLDMDLLKSGKKLRVLNMTELTPLAAEVPFELERSPEYPLWYHLGVGMFNKQAEMFEKRIAEKEYDLILFEHIPVLNNFYPFRVRDSLKLHYRQIDSFAAPRRGETQGVIEVYVP